MLDENRGQGAIECGADDSNELCFGYCQSFIVVRNLDDGAQQFATPLAVQSQQDVEAVSEDIDRVLRLRLNFYVTRPFSEDSGAGIESLLFPGDILLAMVGNDRQQIAARQSASRCYRRSA